MKKAKSEKTKKSLIAYIGAVKRVHHHHKEHRKEEHKRKKRRRKGLGISSEEWKKIKEILAGKKKIKREVHEVVTEDGDRIIIQGHFLPRDKHGETIVIYTRKSKKGSRVIEPANVYPIEHHPRKKKK